LINADFLLDLLFIAEDGGDDVPPKRLLNFNGLHGVVIQKMELFILIFDEAYRL
jgi:hypothetical protein